MSSDYILKWGIVGAGKISSDFVSAILSDPSSKHEIVAVASKSINSSKKFAEKFNISKSYGSYLEMAKDNNDVTVVYIGNLNTEHFHTAKLFLEHGKHLLIEKPMTMNAKETEALTKLAKEKNLFLMEALWSRFLPSYRFINEQLKNGVIGQVCYASANFGVQIADVERIRKRAFGGGTTLDLSIYTLNILQMAFGQNEIPEKIVAAGHLNDDGVDENISAVLNYSNGQTGVISCHSKVQLDNRAIIVGTKGVIKFLPWFHCAEKVMINGDEHTFPLPKSQYKFNFMNSVGLKYEADEVRSMIIDGKLESDLMTHRHSIIFARIMDELLLQLNVKFELN